MKTGLILEGGGQRGIYTVGALDFMMDHTLSFDYCVGVSAGAANGVSYISNQPGRSLRINTEYAKDKRYIGFTNFLREKSFFGMNFIFDTLPNALEPFDYETFFTSPTQMEVGVTRLDTAQEEYFDKTAMREHYRDILAASASVPFFSPKVRIGTHDYYDGGTAAPIPIERALEQGCDKLVIILTREREFVKKPEYGKRFYESALRAYPQMRHLLNTRHEIYNAERNLAFQLEKEGRAIILAPSRPLHLNMFETRRDILMKTWELGFIDASAKCEKLKAFLSKGTEKKSKLNQAI